MLVDGHQRGYPRLRERHLRKPTILVDTPVKGIIATTEVFGPVLGIMHCNTVEDAIKNLNDGEYGNMGSIFTRDGSAARKFRNEADAGNIGINIGVAAPMAFFPFSGWKNSFFGDLHGQGARHRVLRRPRS
jgi:malonate-semialdehyde dehydrogenase (acetylating)/methylmalonate-semialdehyde dehydrogenase